ncbi:MAG: 50S ribosomal protein L10 [Candidatus Moraniibacteriota bacterium]|nr:MAG: 50S ribosomal protein L10 [Candidatus Moranbacteria bacterium]
MQQNKSQKTALVAEVAAKAKESKALVFANFKGVSVKDITALRRSLRETGSSWQVLKKTLLSRALGEVGVKVDARGLDGQIGVAFSSDEVAAAKTIADFLKANKESTLSIVGGSLGSEALSVEAVKALAKLPSRDELRAQLVGTLQAPVSGFVRTLSGNLAGLVRVLGAVRDSKGV